MTMLEIIKGICQFPQRGAGTESEKEASQFVYEVMEKEGMSPRFVEFEMWPDFYKAYALYIVLAGFFGLLTYCHPLVSLIGIVFLSIGIYGDMTTKWYWLRRLFTRLPSRHVIGSYGPENAKKTFLFAGHHDAGQTGYIFNPDSVKNQIRFFKKHFNSPMPQYFPLAFAFICLVLSALIRMGNGNGALPDVLLIIGLIICGIATVLHLSMWGKGFAGGASDNASGVATAIETARRLKDNLPPDTRIIVVSFGAEESIMTGSGLMVPKIFADVDRDNFYVINFEGAGGGHMRYCTGEGFLNFFSYDPELITAARKTGKALELETFKPYEIRSGGTDALAFVHLGIKAITLLGLDEDDYPPHYHWPSDTPENINEETLEEATSIAVDMFKQLA